MRFLAYVIAALQTVDIALMLNRSHDESEFVQKGGVIPVGSRHLFVSSIALPA
jgi:hypothetical protein